MNWFLLLLLKLLPGIDDEPVDDEPPEDDEPVDDEPPADDEPADDETVDEDPEPAEPEPAPRKIRAQRTIRETRERAQKAEADLAAARAELDAARRGPAPQAQPTQDQVLWQQEEEVLRNPESTDWQRYAVNATRASRAAQAEARAANVRAEDLADRTAFAALASTKPKLYDAYKDRVEAKLQELRAQGRNVNREGILKVLIGEDMLEGKLKIGGATTKPNGGAPRATPRSDVAPRKDGGMSEAEKRARRLENIRI